MNHRLHLVLLAVIVLVSFGTAQTVLGPGLGQIRVAFHQTSDLHLTHTPGSTWDYTLTGTFFIDSGKVITIDPGTVIKGDVAASLVISPRAKIHAVGTLASPIVFTSVKPVGQRAPGDWGGVILLGRAPVNQGNPQIEGGIIPGFYGSLPGSPEPHDNSGEFQYVRIEFPGYRYQLNNEINGLTCGGVGDGTTIDHVEVAYSSDDSFEWFGGTVNCKYLVAIGGTDDEFDTDFGFSGKLQFLFSMRDPEIWDPTGQSNGFESDNCDPKADVTPYTAAVFCNVTMIGPQRTNAIALYPGNNFEYGAVLRRYTQMNCLNSVIAGYKGGMSLRDRLNDGVHPNPEVKSTNIYISPTATLALYHTSGGTFTSTDVKNWFETAAYNNVGSTAGADAAGFTNLASLTAPDPRPTVSSPLVTGAVEPFTNPKLSDAFFTPTTYRGAFAPGVAMWTDGWCVFDYGVQSSTTYNVVAGWNLLSTPRVPVVGTPSVVFPGSVNGTIYGYNGSSYSTPTAVIAGPGYWALYTSAQSITASGAPVNNVAASVAFTVNSATDLGQQKWMLWGSASGAQPIAAVRTSVTSNIANYTPPNQDRLVSGTIYGYNGSAYVAPTTIEPGKGYWALVKSATVADPPTSYPCTETVYTYATVNQ
jgi:hypothetical protein